MVQTDCIHRENFLEWRCLYYVVHPKINCAWWGLYMQSKEIRWVHLERLMHNLWVYLECLWQGVFGYTIMITLYTPQFMIIHNYNIEYSIHPHKNVVSVYMVVDIRFLYSPHKFAGVFSNMLITTLCTHTTAIPRYHIREIEEILLTTLCTHT